ncbi:MAG: P-II family nitrogen regulator [Candidatus Binatia bacterium]
MKKIEAIVRVATLETVIEALVRRGVAGITLSHVRGSGRQRGHCELYRGPDYVVNLLPKIKLEVLVADECVDEMIGVVQTVAYTGRIGDGKIVVSHVDEVARIRTGERGKQAI